MAGTSTETDSYRGNTRSASTRAGELTQRSEQPALPARSTGPAAPRPALPFFPGGSLPEAEPAWVTFRIRTLAVLTLAVSLAYLGWRALFTLDLTAWWIALPFLALEIHASISLALIVFSLWDLHARTPAQPVETTPERVAVLIPTTDESRAILLPTVAAAVALKPDHETWVLDDGNRPWVAELAAELGARYLTRSDRSHAKAGNINHALGVVEADIVAILGADYVATPLFLINTLGYFDDARIALVQTPRGFYNLDSFEHETTTTNDRIARQDRYHEQALFYRAIQPGKNRWGAALCCDTGVIVRVPALRELGGFATDTITEGIHTTIRLHRHGWKTVYHNEVLARGLAASTADLYQFQRLRWGTGAMQVLRVENPLIVPGLRLGQRFAHAATLLGGFEAWRSLGYFIIPMLVLLTGVAPIQADPLVFLLFFGTTFILQQIAAHMLSRGYSRLILPAVFDLVRMTPTLLATLTFLRRQHARFQVTPPRHGSAARPRAQPPRLLQLLAALSCVSGLWFILTITGYTPTRYEAPWVAYGAACWLGVNSILVVLAIARVRAVRFGAERRASFRFSTALNGSLDESPCRVDDVSLTGALISFERTTACRAAVGSTTHRFTIDLEGASIHLRAMLRSRRISADGRVLYGIEFRNGQPHAQAALALALFNAQIMPTIIHRPARSVT